MLLIPNRPRQALEALPAALPPDRLTAARGAYSQLQRAALRAVADLAMLQSRVRALVGQLAIQHEAAEGGFSDAVQVVDKWREGRDRAQREVGAAAVMQGGWREGVLTTAGGFCCSEREDPLSALALAAPTCLLVAPPTASTAGHPPHHRPQRRPTPWSQQPREPRRCVCAWPTCPPS